MAGQGWQDHRPAWENTALVGRALHIYRVALRQFVVRTLRRGNPDWLQECVLPALRNSHRGRQIVRSVEADRDGIPTTDLNSQSATGLGARLGIVLTRDVIEYNWESTFQQEFRSRDVLAEMKEVHKWRNVWAHEDIDAERVRNALDACHVVLQQIDPGAAAEIDSLREMANEDGS